MSGSMTAWSVSGTGPVRTNPPTLGSREIPGPRSEELLVEVSACGVCRTDLHLVEGDLPPRRPGVVPGHQVVGRVAALGADVTRFELGDRVGIAWLHRTCGECRWCRRGAENLCPRSQYTGWDVDGGFAQYAVVPAAYAYALPPGVDDEQVAPLLCAGIIGYRALRRAAVPEGGRLGLYGFGSSAHLTAQIAMARGAEVFVMTRGQAARDLAEELGAAWVGDAYDAPPVPLDSGIVFAPAGELVPPALEALDRGGTLALAGIHMSAIPQLDYARHVFLERTLTSVTSNTRADGEELLRLAERVPLRVHVTAYPYEAVDRALSDLAQGRVAGSLVIGQYPGSE